MNHAVYDDVRTYFVQDSDWVTFMFRIVFFACVVKPLSVLYFEGPSLNGYLGFWAGMPPTEICARVTHTPASMWVAPNTWDECTLMLLRMFYSFYVSVMGMVYVTALYRLVQYFLLVRPIQHEIRLLQKVLTARKALPP